MRWNDDLVTLYDLMRKFLMKILQLMKLGVWQTLCLRVWPEIEVSERLNYKQLFSKSNKKKFSLKKVILTEIGPCNNYY